MGQRIKSAKLFGGGIICDQTHPNALTSYNKPPFLKLAEAKTVAGANKATSWLTNSRSLIQFFRLELICNPFRCESLFPALPNFLRSLALRSNAPARILILVVTISFFVSLLRGGDQTKPCLSGTESCSTPFHKWHRGGGFPHPPRSGEEKNLAAWLARTSRVPGSSAFPRFPTHTPLGPVQIFQPCCRWEYCPLISQHAREADARHPRRQRCHQIVQTSHLSRW